MKYKTINAFILMQKISDYVQHITISFCVVQNLREILINKLAKYKAECNIVCKL